MKQTLGTIPEDLLGIAGGDWLHQQRQRNVLAMKAKTEEIRLRIGAGPPNAPSPSVVLPLLIGAADESRPELQDLWAALLASALQPDGGERVRRAFFDTLKAMEPVDARLFRALAAYGPGALIGDQVEARIEEDLRLFGAAAAVGWEALTKLGLIRTSLNKQMTLYGQEFWRACNPSM
ncbi:Abi-alpha family protein [Sediminicoccus rosea]|uniref:Abi-alpha family protein n=1 Tax=Sediminicoccus rosea TaxID=1225128 RepID=A0ABZ0PLJ3_9PROT|nr:Abi-alpha family protein [Sediminicoccus rosea]WPB86608.1 Abi-alpha family protein [Sediminicoccus rosea]